MFRRGQWVKLTKDLDLGGESEKAGTVGIHVQTRGDVCEVHLVTFPKGETRKICGIAPSDLVAVTELSELPQDRVRDPNWSPKA